MEIDQFKALRADALDRGMPELALVYGWAAITLMKEALGMPLDDIIGDGKP